MSTVGEIYRSRKALFWTMIGVLVAVLCLGGFVTHMVMTDLDAQNARLGTLESQRNAAEEESAQRGQVLEEAGLPVPTVSPAPGQPGRAGVSGPAGADGQDGVDGRDGVDGADGTDGVDGLDGIDGVDGAIGPTGATGPAGPTGPPGPVGPQGEQGQQGEPGAAGPSGASGQNGAAGQPPVSWTFTSAGADYVCTRTEPFDAGAPTYTCTTTAARPPDPTPTEVPPTEPEPTETP